VAAQRGSVRRPERSGAGAGTRRHGRGPR
jgi:hypothetical protein